MNSRNIPLSDQLLYFTFRLYKSLAPSAETYVFDSGEMAQLLNLGGTIPIMYRDQNYNIPIKIWLPCSYPEEPPFCYVIPTREMELSVSPYVDHSGLVELACLSEWNHNVTDLVTILQIARATFSETPPVFAKPRQARRKENKEEFESVWDEHYPDEEEKMLKSFFLTSASEECRTKLGEEYSRTRAEVESLHSINKELIDRQEELDRLRERLAELKVEAREDVKTVRQARDLLKEVQEARSITTRVTSETVDELVKVNKASDRQLMEAVANDEAIKDCVYSLDQALRKDRISVDIYLKKVRELSREQFSCRLLISKIQEREKRMAEGDENGAKVVGLVQKLPRQQSLP